MGSSDGYREEKEGEKGEGGEEGAHQMFVGLCGQEGRALGSGRRQQGERARTEGERSVGLLAEQRRLVVVGGRVQGEEGTELAVTDCPITRRRPFRLYLSAAPSCVG